MKFVSRHWVWSQFLLLSFGAAICGSPALGRSEEPTTPVATSTPPSAAVDLVKIFSGGVPESVADLKAMQGHLQKLIERVSPCTVGVRVGAAQGSGVIISKDGYVLTAAHVVGKPEREVVFILHDGRQVKGKTLGMNSGIDAGLMKISEDGEWPFVEMGVSTDCKEGQWCLATGHPGGYEKGRRPVVRVGRVLSNRSGVITTDCTLVGGDSGGPLFDMEGKVIGIHSRIGGPLTANMHVPVNTFRETWDRLAKGEEWGQLFGAGGPYIGVKGTQDSDVAKIEEVFPDAPAAKAGIKPGDVIMKFDGQAITNFASLSSQVGNKKPGDKVKLEIRRGEESLELELVVGKRGG
jgi:serine protease Do